MRLVIIDNYDSFTYNLVQYFQVLGAGCEVYLNDGITASDVIARNAAGLVLSPGPGAPEDAGITLEALRLAAGTVPILGVCLGHQAVAHHFGARIVRAPAPVHGKADRVAHDGSGLFRGIPSPFAAARYHSLVVDASTLPASLRVVARCGDGTVMALSHRDAHIDTVQFHPESILSEHGIALLRNWLEGL